MVLLEAIFWITMTCKRRKERKKWRRKEEKEKNNTSISELNGRTCPISTRTTQKEKEKEIEKQKHIALKDTKDVIRIEKSRRIMNKKKHDNKEK